MSAARPSGAIHPKHQFVPTAIRQLAMEASTAADLSLIWTQDQLMKAYKLGWQDARDNEEPAHASDCICADCSNAELTSDND